MRDGERSEQEEGHPYALLAPHMLAMARAEWAKDRSWELSVGAAIKSPMWVVEPQLLEPSLLPPRVCTGMKWELGAGCGNQALALQHEMQAFWP